MANRWLGSSLGLCALGGLAMALAMPPYGLWLLAWVAIVPLWRWTMASSELGWKQRLGYAAVWTVLYEGVTTHWIWDLHPLTWMGIPWVPSVAIAVFAWFAVVVWRVLSVMLWTQLTARLGRGRSPGLRVLIGVAICCAVDLLWSCGPLYWANFGLSQSPGNLAILQLGRLGGPAAVTGAIVAVNGLLAEAWLLTRKPGVDIANNTGFPSVKLRGSDSAQSARFQMGQAPKVLRSRKAGAKQLWGGALLLAIALHGLGALMYSQAKASVAIEAATVTPVKIGIVQGNVPTREKLSEVGVNLGVRRYTEGFRALAEQGAEAVLLPEGALPFVWSQGRERWGKDLLGAIADYPETKLWLGTFERAEDGESFSQSLLSLGADGKPTGRYNKVKLVPLGEYLPGGRGLRMLLESMGVGRLSSLPVGMVPGERGQVFESGLGKVAVMICYEPAFSGGMRGQVANGGRWLVTSSNLDPYGRQLMAQAEALDVMRAVEGDRWSIRATNTGFSGGVDPVGRVRWRSEVGEVVTYLAEVYPRDSRTAYVRWGDWVVWSLLGLAGVGLVVWR